INAAGGKAEFIKLDEPGWWQGSYTGPYEKDYVGPFTGVSHMMMMESNPAPNGKATNLQVMDVILEWAGNNIDNPDPMYCGGEVPTVEDIREKQREAAELVRLRAAANRP